MPEAMKEQEDEFDRPLLVLDIRKVEPSTQTRRGKDRSSSEERVHYRLHVVFRKTSEVTDFQRKKDWVFDSELNITNTRYVSLLRMFKESLEGIERKPNFVTFASNFFSLFKNKF